MTAANPPDAGAPQAGDPQEGGPIKDRREFLRRAATLGIANFGILSIGAGTGRGQTPATPTPVPAGCGSYNASGQLNPDLDCGYNTGNGTTHSDSACGKSIDSMSPTVYSNDYDCGGPQSTSGGIHSDSACGKVNHSGGVQTWHDLDCGLKKPNGTYMMDSDCGDPANPEGTSFWIDNDCGLQFMTSGSLHSDFTPKIEPDLLVDDP